MAFLLSLISGFLLPSFFYKKGDCTLMGRDLDDLIFEQADIKEHSEK